MRNLFLIFFFFYALIVVYAPRIYLIEVKVSIYLFFFCEPITIL